MEPPTSSLSREEVLEGKKSVRDQLQDLAFNIFGKAIEDKSGERDKHQVIVARNPSSKHWNDVLKKDGGAQGTPVYRASMDFTLREQCTDSAPELGTARFLVVGYAKPNLDKKYKTMDAGTKQVVGVHRPSQVLPWDDDEHRTCYVVTPIQDQQPDQRKSYVLLMPENELCSPYVLAKDDIFYRYEYRNTEKSVVARRTSWTKKIAQRSVQVGRRMFPSTKQEISKRALKAFLGASAVEFERKTALEVVQEVATLWPDIQGLTAERVLVLKQLMARHDAEIKNFQVKGLLAEGMYRLALQDDCQSIMDEEGFVRDLVSNLDRILGKEAQPKPTASDVDECITGCSSRCFACEARVHA